MLIFVFTGCANPTRRSARVQQCCTEFAIFVFRISNSIPPVLHTAPAEHPQMGIASAAFKKKIVHRVMRILQRAKKPVMARDCGPPSWVLQPAACFAQSKRKLDDLAGCHLGGPQSRAMTTVGGINSPPSISQSRPAAAPSRRCRPCARRSGPERGESESSPRRATDRLRPRRRCGNSASCHCEGP